MAIEFSDFFPIMCLFNFLYNLYECIVELASAGQLSRVSAVVKVSVCLFVHHTLALYQNGDT